MISILLVFVLNSNTYIIINDTLPNMEECVLEMHRITYVMPEEKRLKYICVSANEIITNN